MPGRRGPGGEGGEHALDLRDGQWDHAGLDGWRLIGPGRGRCLGIGAVLDQGGGDGGSPLTTSTLFGCIALARLYVEDLKLYIVPQSIPQRSPALDQLGQPYVKVSRGDLLWCQARRPEDLSPSDDGSC
jgi:hypothetical protein